MEFSILYHMRRRKKMFCGGACSRPPRKICGADGAGKAKEFDNFLSIVYNV